MMGGGRREGARGVGFGAMGVEDWRKGGESMMPLSVPFWTALRQTFLVHLCPCHYHCTPATCTGGKWTTYRLMAEDAINRALVTQRIPTTTSSCCTEDLRLIGGQRHTPQLHAQVRDWKGMLFTVPGPRSSTLLSWDLMLGGQRQHIDIDSTFSICFHRNLLGMCPKLPRSACWAWCKEHACSFR